MADPLPAAEVADGAAAPVTGTMLRDLVVCERRVHHDLHGDPGARDAVSDFVVMLRDGGVLHEDAVVETLPGSVSDLRREPVETRADRTRAAMAGFADWIVGARLELDDRVGHPDLLWRTGGAWHAGDIKAGTAWADDGITPKAEYAVQVGHYAALLGRLGAGEAGRAFIVGRDGRPAWFDLSAPRGRGREDWAAHVAALVETARGVRDGRVATTGALSAACAMCHWKTVCRAELHAADDLTLIAGLGRATRAVIAAVAPTISALAALDVQADPGPSRGLP